MKTTRPISRLAALSLAVLLAVPVFAASAPKKVLMVTVTAGFRHSCIPLSEEVVAQLAKESGKFTVDYVRQPTDLPKAPARPRKTKGGDEAAFKAAMEKYTQEEKAYQAALTPKLAAALQKLSPANLKNYDAVLFASTTGDLPLPDKQGFVDWIASGKGFIGVHAAADTFEKSARFAGFPPYIEMLGGAFQTHGPQVAVDCINDDPSHAACKHLPKTWSLFDEIYEFKEYNPSKVHRLLSLDKHPQTKAPGHNPIAWNKAHGKGRVFYTALGHREDLWDPSFTDKQGRKNPPEIARQFRQHVLGGILWALNLAPGDAKPQPVKK